MTTSTTLRTSAKQRNQEYLNKVTEFAVHNGLMRNSVMIKDVAKLLDVSSQTAEKYMKLFVTQGHFSKDREIKSLFWLKV